VATIRSQQKAQRIADQYGGLSRSRLSFAVVRDVAEPEAFKEALISNLPIDAVVHTASPFHFDIESPADFLDPAIKGTISILKAVKDHAPTVKRVVSHLHSTTLTILTYNLTGSDFILRRHY
jgi:nucleoside-diphosphate-sugar epimerase